MNIHPLPVPTRIAGGEGLVSYASRHAARNGTTVMEVEQALHQTGAIPRPSHRRTPERLQAWRHLGALHEHAFAAPAKINGAEVIDRALCLRCTQGSGGTGRIPRIGWICSRHRRWIGAPQHDIRALPELAAAERHYRRVLAPRGALVRTPIMELARECALVGTSRNLIASRAKRALSGLRDMLVYPETVRIARLVTSPSFNTRMLGPELAQSDRNDLAARTVAEIIPADKDSEPWRAAHRIADVFNTVARDHAKRFWHGGQHRALEPTPRAWAIWGNGHPHPHNPGRGHP